MKAQLKRRLFTVEEYHQMARAGVLKEDDRVELIEGEIVRMSPISSQHAACVMRLTKLFAEVLGGRAILDAQNPVRIGVSSEPQPDLMLLLPRDDFYASNHPGPEDVLLVIEVAGSSLREDREVKLPLYARAGIEEAWLVDLENQAVEVYRGPGLQGYRIVSRQERGSSLQPSAFSDINLTVDEILG